MQCLNMALLPEDFHNVFGENTRLGEKICRIRYGGAHESLTLYQSRCLALTNPTTAPRSHL